MFHERIQPGLFDHLPVIALALTSLLFCFLAAPGSGVARMPTAKAQGLTALPSGFIETQVASGLANPTAMQFAPDGRLFVCEQAGKLRVIKNGALLAAPFVSLAVNSAGERGLLGVAFDPNFATNNFLYLYYTVASTPIHNRISRFTANGDVAVPGSELIIFELNNLSATNHNGGAIHFGPDGKLFVGVGENAVGTNSQTLTNLLGKILRINSDGSIPADNPFFGSAMDNNRAIWALGLRNPFTFAFQPGTGRIFINDVGETTWEEINDGIAGANYGWPDTEGPTGDPRFRSPIFAYTHGGGATTGCAIAGGAFYNPPTQQFPSEYVGDYFFADLCSGWIRRFHPSSGMASGFATGISNPVDLKVSSTGTLFYLARGPGSDTGVVFEIRSTSSFAPSISVHPVDKTVTVGSPATFSVQANGQQPLSYQWQRNQANIQGATSSSFTLASAQLSDDGDLFRCVVSNSFGTATSNEALLRVLTNQTPTAAITQPVAGTVYSAGQTINFAGTGTDPEDGNLPPSAFTWRIDFHHDDHTHPFLQPTSGITSGSFVVPTTGETSANVFYRIHLTIVDSGLLQHSVFRDVRPRTVTITLTATPSGPQVTLDGQPQITPVSFLGVVGMIRTIGAPSPQTINGRQFTFKSWTDGGAQTHTIVTPAANTTFTARYQKQKR
jgi:glucose/arabinose dehydrogenase